MMVLIVSLKKLKQNIKNMMERNALKILFRSFFVLLFASCLKEELLKAEANFQFTEIPITDGKKAVFSNLSKNADTFEWTFENGIPASSTKFSPGEVKFTIKGTHLITLKVANREGSVTQITKSITIN